MQISIGKRRFELSSCCTDGLTEAQAQTLSYLWNQTSSQLDLNRVLVSLGLNYPASLEARMKHLEDRGKLKELHLVTH